MIFLSIKKFDLFFLLLFYSKIDGVKILTYHLLVEDRYRTKFDLFEDKQITKLINTLFLLV